MFPSFAARDGRRYIAVLLLSCAWIAGAGAAEPGPDPIPGQATAPHGVLTLEAALATALSDNPGLAEMQARADAMAAVPSQVGTLPDPVLGLNALNFPTDTFSRTQEPMTQLQIGLSQKLPFPGKLGLKEDAARFEAEAAASRFDETRLALIRNIQQAWWELFYIDRGLETVKRNQDLMRQFVDIARTKYEVGQGLQQDVLLAQLELSKLLDMEITLKGARKAQQARLNALLDRNADSPVALPHKVDPEMAEVPGEATLFAEADEMRPALAEQRRMIEASDARLELAHKEYYPDFNVGVAYGFRGGNNADGSDRPDMASVMFSLNLPIFAGSKRDELVDQRNAEKRRAQLALRRLQQDIRAEISSAVAGFERAREQALLFRTGIIPQARQTVASMNAGYQVNKVDFLNLVSAQVTLYNYELQYWRALTRAKTQRAVLATAVGKESL